MKFTIIKNVWQWFAAWFNRKTPATPAGEQAVTAAEVATQVERITVSVAQQLEKMTKNQIAAYAAQRGIKVSSRKTKDKMIAAVIDAIK